MILTAMVFTLTGLVTAAPPPTPAKVTVIFTGICTFTKDRSGKPIVLFPKATNVTTPSGQPIPDHLTYVRYRQADVSSNTHKRCHDTPKNPLFERVCSLDRERLELAGPIKVGGVVEGPTYLDLIVPMKDIVDDASVQPQYLDWPTAAPLAARFDVPGGTLSAEDIRQYDWLFQPTKTGVTPRKLGQKVILEIETTSGADPVELRSSDGTKIVFKPGQDVAIEIGQIMKTEVYTPHTVTYKTGDPDNHFYLHYGLLGSSCKVNGTSQSCPIPIRVGRAEAPKPTGALASRMTIWNYLAYGSNCPPRR